MSVIKLFAMASGSHFTVCVSEELKTAGRGRASVLDEMQMVHRVTDEPQSERNIG